LIEFRNFATRPEAVDGLGASASEADKMSGEFERSFHLIEETPAIFPAWNQIVSQAGVIGKQVHDARLVAVCQAHGVANC
jgi:hypothetical protein